jgi:Translation initiation factor SUI1
MRMPKTGLSVQKVTRVVGVETFLLDASEVAADLQRRFAAAATVTELPGEKSKGHYEIVLQVCARVGSDVGSQWSAGACVRLTVMVRLLPDVRPCAADCSDGGMNTSIFTGKWVHTSPAAGRREAVDVLSSTTCWPLRARS